jgi:hypothetical protein
MCYNVLPVTILKALINCMLQRCHLNCVENDSWSW